ncbi:hypothetical protein HaLaN_16300 [Haematococcus lacustris]|uniref:Uncharacterized protein n=1 Tax=Haematococcus lacustris TaxID=44745 RepID=A0A699Z9R8_HAELA|nr:hypothetical protein HaLaN_16300 [Haematococcus lacustris]
MRNMARIKAMMFAMRSFTLRGLMRRVARLADTQQLARTHQRLAALSWIAATASTLGE